MKSFRARLRSLLDRLVYGGSSRLRPYESFCVASLLGQLHPATRSVVEAQISTVSLIQRFGRDKLVTFHFLGTSVESLPLATNRTSELTVARLVIEDAISVSKVRCDIVFDEGRISSLEFDRSPRFLKSAKPICRQVQVYEDIPQPPPCPGPGMPPESRVAMLERIKSQRPVAKILPPADEGVLRRFLDRLGMAIPGDYVELLRDTDGFAVDAWQFHGTKARKIVRDDSNYYLVAEDPEHALCLREGQTLAEVIYYDQIDDEVTVMGRSFVEALLEVTQATDLEGS